MDVHLEDLERVRARIEALKCECDYWKKESETLRALVNSLARRVQEQSDLLSRFAEKK